MNASTILKPNDLPVVLRQQITHDRILFAFKTKLRQRPDGLNDFIIGVLLLFIVLFFTAVFINELFKSGKVTYRFNGQPMIAVPGDWHSYLLPLLLALLFLAIVFDKLYNSYAYFVKNDIIYVGTDKALFYLFKDEIKTYNWSDFENVTIPNKVFYNIILLHFKKELQNKLSGDKEKKAHLFLANPPGLYHIYHLIKERG